MVPFKMLDAFTPHPQHHPRRLLLLLHLHPPPPPNPFRYAVLRLAHRLQVRVQDLPSLKDKAHALALSGGGVRAADKGTHAHMHIHTHTPSSDESQGVCVTCVELIRLYYD